MHLTVSGGKVVKKSFETDLIPVDAAKADPVMREHFRKDFETVRAFTLQEVGELKTDLRTRDAYAGMSDYVNLIHTLCLSQAPAELSIAAPLTYNGTVKAGTLVFNDLFTIYPFENQLCRIRMSGREIRNYLEYSYDQWIRDPREGGHIFRIVPRDDPRTGQQRWSFTARSYNFDSAAGLNYTVDVTQPLGSRVQITSLAGGSPFSEEAEYSVAVTSYRANGGGGLLLNGAGLDSETVAARTEAHFPEIRELVFDFVQKNGVIGPELFSDPAVLGRWRFVPEALCARALRADMDLLF
jgi:2',3'-cyclic-nucleotide 2'-phosphodiesterase/3'-nucleotidase